MNRFFSMLTLLLIVGQSSSDTNQIAASDITLNVVTLGADPSGEKDSSAVFQKAFDAGGTIIVPHGSYRITKTLTLTRSETAVIGQPQALLLYPKGFKESALVIKGEPFSLRDVVLRDLVIECDQANYTPGNDSKYACGITLSGVDGAVVESCTVRWFTFTGIYVAASKNVRVSDCSTLGGRHGIGINGHIGNPAKNNEPYGCANITVSDCRIRETWDTFIPVGLCASFVTISGCQCEGSAAHGIDIFNSDHVTVTGNTLHNWMDPSVAGHTGLAVTDVASKTKRYAPQNVYVTGNIFTGQQSVMWVESEILMTAVISQNIFSPLSDGSVAHLGEKTQGVRFSGNTLTHGSLPKIPPGIIWQSHDK